jgi:hypothetical protein
VERLDVVECGAGVERGIHASTSNGVLLDGRIGSA